MEGRVGEVGRRRAPARAVEREQRVEVVFEGRCVGEAGRPRLLGRADSRRRSCSRKLALLAARYSSQLAGRSGRGSPRVSTGGHRGARANPRRRAAARRRRHPSRGASSSTSQRGRRPPARRHGQGRGSSPGPWPSGAPVGSVGARRRAEGRASEAVARTCRMEKEPPSPPWCFHHSLLQSAVEKMLRSARRYSSHSRSTSPNPSTACARATSCLAVTDAPAHTRARSDSCGPSRGWSACPWASRSCSSSG